MPIAFSRPTRSCILRSAARSDFKSSVKSENSLLKKGPGRPKKKILNPEADNLCEPEYYEKIVEH
jgi:hypothetical protein